MQDLQNHHYITNLRNGCYDPMIVINGLPHDASLCFHIYSICHQMLHYFWCVFPLHMHACRLWRITIFESFPVKQSHTLDHLALAILTVNCSIDYNATHQTDIETFGWIIEYLTWLWGKMKGQRLTTVSRIHPLGTMTVCTTFHGNPANTFIIVYFIVDQSGGLTDCC